MKLLKGNAYGANYKVIEYSFKHKKWQELESLFVVMGDKITPDMFISYRFKINNTLYTEFSTEFKKALNAEIIWARLQND